MSKPYIKPKDNSSEKTKIDFFEQINNYVEKTNLEINSELVKHKIDLEKKYAEDIKLKQKLIEFAKNNKLGEALISVWDEIQHYHAWQHRDDFARLNLLGVYSVESSEKDKDRFLEIAKRNIEKSTCGKIEKNISFNWQDTSFKLIEEETCWHYGWSYDSSRGQEMQRTLSLFEAEELIFQIVQTRYQNDPYSCYGGAGVNILKKKGIWGEFLIDSWKITKIKGEKRNIEIGYAKADKIKNNFQE